MLHFPPLTLDSWQDSRDTLHRYCQVLANIRRSMTPPQKHLWHIGLRTNALGLTTTPIPAGSQTFEINLDLANHMTSIHTSRGDLWDLVLEGQPLKTFTQDTLDALYGLGIEPPFKPEAVFTENEWSAGPTAYDDLRIDDYWQALSQIDMALKAFRGGFRRESSPVQLWPSRFDLSLVWFSGRLVAGQDPNDPEHADEQMGFGFSTGDSDIPDPYLYVTTYPWREELTHTPLPAGAQWHDAEWQGACLMYAALVKSDDPQGLLMDYWTTVHNAGKALMLG